METIVLYNIQGALQKTKDIHMNRYFDNTDFCLSSVCPRLMWTNRRAPGELPQSFAAEQTVDRLNRRTASKQLASIEKGCVVLSVCGESELICATENLFSGGKVPPMGVCGAAFRSGSFVAYTDLLCPDREGGVIMYCVRPALHIRPMNIREAAFCAQVVQDSGIAVSRVIAVCLDSAYVRGGEKPLSQMFRFTDITGECTRKSREVMKFASRMLEVLNSPKAPDISLNASCITPEDCPALHHHRKQLEDPNILDMCGVSRKTKLLLIRETGGALRTLKNSPALSPLEKRQVRMITDNIPPVIDARGIKSFLSTLSYPLCFLDFESYQPPVPPFDGLRPFEPLAFQYSMHVRYSPDLPPVHRSFLAPAGTDPRRAMAAQLAEDIPEGACLVAYNMQFEAHVLETLADMFPEYAPYLNTARKNMRDLMKVFSKRQWYDGKMMGSFSLKAVVAALFPDDKSVGYQSLHGVHNGCEAMNAYALAAAGETRSTKDDLLDYCAMDTMSMVKITELLYKAVSGNNEHISHDESGQHTAT